MRSMSEIITDANNTAFIEQKCCIELSGHKFCSGGSWLCENVKTGKFEGMLYACHKPDPEIGMHVSSWDGSLKIRANYWKKDYRDNFGGLRQDVYFVYNGRYFWGKWYGKEWSDIIRCVEISEKSYFGYSLTSAKKRGLFK
jgi:hypothetical protein